MSETNPQRSEATVKTAIPRLKIRRRPYLSPSAPPTRIKAESVRAYDPTLHCACTVLAFNLDCKTGRATLMTVPSINVMLEPIIVAAKTQFPAAYLSVTSAETTLSGAECTTASSHGCLS